MRVLIYFLLLFTSSLHAQNVLTCYDYSDFQQSDCVGCGLKDSTFSGILLVKNGVVYQPLMKPIKVKTRPNILDLEDGFNTRVSIYINQITTYNTEASVLSFLRSCLAVESITSDSIYIQNDSIFLRDGDGYVYMPKDSIYLKSGTTKDTIRLRDGSGAALVDKAPIDSTNVINQYGTIITESPANTFNVRVDSSLIATQDDINGTVKGVGVPTRVAWWGGVDSLSSNANFYWDNVNNELEIKSIPLGSRQASNFYIGNNAGGISTGIDNSFFVGDNAGYNSTGSFSSNFLGLSAGINSSGSLGSNFVGQYSGRNATNAWVSNFFGANSGDGAYSSDGSNFLGWVAGGSAYNSKNSNFLGSFSGRNARNSSNCNFLGVNAGDGAYNNSNSVFIGSNTGLNANTITDGIFIGRSSGANSVGGTQSVFNGLQSGESSNGCGSSVYLGVRSGQNAVNGYQSFFGLTEAGKGSQNLYNSLILGFQSALNVSTSNHLIVIGTKTVDNNVGPNNILVGNYITLPNASTNMINFGNVLYVKDMYNGTVSGVISQSAKSDGKIGIGTISPNRTLEVNGEVRISDLVTDNATKIVGADGDGDLSSVTVGNGISITGGNLTANINGTIDRVAKFTTQYSVGNSQIYTVGDTLVGINQSNPQYHLDVTGKLRVTNRTGTAATGAGFTVDGQLISYSLDTASSTPNTYLTSGTFVTITGDGTMGNPYVINNNKPENTHVKDSPQLDFVELTNDTITATVIPSSIGATELSNTTVSAGTYVFSSVTVDQDGRITSASNGSEVDGSVTNEIQDLSLAGQTLSITSDLTPVTLPIIDVVAGTGISISKTSGAATVTNIGDLSNTNELQNLAFTTESGAFTFMDISGGTGVWFEQGTGIDLVKTASNTLKVNNIGLLSEVDGSTTNELQTISTNGAAGNITISSGNTININVNDADASSTNEIQSLSFNTEASGFIYQDITGGTGVNFKQGTGIDLIREASNVISVNNTGDLSNTNEIQVISTTGAAGNITLSGANTLNLNINDADASPTNELQNLAFTTQSGAYTFMDISGGTGVWFEQGVGIDLVKTASNILTVNAINNGTVTSVATTNGITGGTITSTGTVQLTGQASALHNLGTNGVIVRTGSGTVEARTITAGDGITVTNGNGVSGNPTISAFVPYGYLQRNSALTSRTFDGTFRGFTYNVWGGYFCTTNNTSGTITINSSGMYEVSYGLTWSSQNGSSNVADFYVLLNGSGIYTSRVLSSEVATGSYNPISRTFLIYLYSSDVIELSYARASGSGTLINFESPNLSMKKVL